MAFDQVGDEELVTRFQNGESAAFSEIFRRNEPAVSRLVARMLGLNSHRRVGTEELEDLVQEVFVQVYRSLATFRGQSRLGTWIYRIAINVVLMHRRSLRSRPALTHTELPVETQHPGLLPDDEFIRKRNVAALYQQLEKLSEKKRTVFILHEIEGLSPAEIAKAVDAPVLTVRTRLFYARRELLELFRSDPYLSTLTNEMDLGALANCEAGSSVRLRTSVPDPTLAEPAAGEKLS